MPLQVDDVHTALMESGPRSECETARVLHAADSTPLAETGGVPEPVPIPGRPPRPWLIHPAQLNKRGLGKPAGRVALIHAIAHLEFNAINLGLDAAYGFRGRPAAFYADWRRVADDESRHFERLNARLADYGHAYGDFDAHNGRWEMATKTAFDVMIRMALVPRVLEARGLDVAPGMIDRLRQSGDDDIAAILTSVVSWIDQRAKPRGR